MDTLLYFQSIATMSAMQKLDGVCQAAREHGWMVARFDLRDPAQIRDEIRVWRPVGCVVEAAADDVELPSGAFGRVPAVLLDCNPALARRRFPAVVQHPTAIGAFAAANLLELDLPAYAYVGHPERKFWDRMRREAFCRAVRDAGRPVFRIDTGDADGDIRMLRERIAAGLATLPRPAGVYCANDAIAVQTLEAALAAGFSVPNDIALLGTDNEGHLCENASPTLSSIELDFAGAGRRCVEIVAERIAHGGGKRVRETFGPLRIVRRTSTRRSARLDRSVVAAMDLIRARAVTNVSPREVVALFGCSRRMAEMRFRAATGHSILDEIHDVQIEHAKKLLDNPRVKASMVPSLCGYGSNPFFMRLFRRATGMSMGEWRERRIRESAMPSGSNGSSAIWNVTVCSASGP